MTGVAAEATATRGDAAASGVRALRHATNAVAVTRMTGTEAVRALMTLMHTVKRPTTSNREALLRRE